MMYRFDRKRLVVVKIALVLLCLLAYTAGVVTGIALWMPTQTDIALLHASGRGAAPTMAAARLPVKLPVLPAPAAAGVPVKAASAPEPAPEPARPSPMSAMAAPLPAPAGAAPGAAPGGAARSPGRRCGSARHPRARRARAGAGRPGPHHHRRPRRSACPATAGVTGKS